MVSQRTRVASWIFRRDHPSRPKAMICCFFSSFKTFAMLREATYPPAVVNVLDISSESMAAFQVFLYGRFWVFTEGTRLQPDLEQITPAVTGQQVAARTLYLHLGFQIYGREPQAPIGRKRLCRRGPHDSEDSQNVDKKIRKIRR